MHFVPEESVSPFTHRGHPFDGWKARPLGADGLGLGYSLVGNRASVPLSLTNRRFFLIVYDRGAAAVDGSTAP